MRSLVGRGRRLAVVLGKQQAAAGVAEALGQERRRRVRAAGRRSRRVSGAWEH